MFVATPICWIACEIIDLRIIPNQSFTPTPEALSATKTMLINSQGAVRPAL
jgi:hypothetical protein